MPVSDVTPDLAFGATWPSLEVFQILAKDRRGAVIVPPGPGWGLPA